ncbi:MAG TPA: flagellar motor protein MotA [Cytophagales bacterium]|nr:flagellar motor protein MotA [Cytophagales bacterium]HAA19921.1 flagellar motor protein MotA [Cytophagales bacterium]HAP62651.1 flagellar motor protein MotA [Cytophagales bacterium]
MKKLLALFLLAGIFTFGITSTVSAQDDMDTTNTSDTTMMDVDSAGGDDSAAMAAPAEEDMVEDDSDAEMEAEDNLQYVIRDKFIEGDWRFMSPVLICLILGLAIALERIITLNLATTNTKKLLARVEDGLAAGGVDAAKEVTKGTRGPVASIFTQGLMRIDEGIDMVEKSIVSYGSVEMGRLERGLVWVSLFISLAPMLGFMGTVIGMIGAFDSIEAAGDISPQVVASGIKIALLTTVAGLIVGIILQIFYNYLVSKVDALVNQMEDASISLVDLLVRHQNSGK